MRRRIKKAAVIGSGVMGSSIAALCASAGIRTLLLDVVPADLKEEEKNNPAARNKIVQSGLEAVKKANPPAFMDKDKDLLLINTGNLEDDINKINDCDIIFEAVVENLKVKRNLFASLEKVRKETAIVASNTSGLPLSAMSEGLSEEFKRNFVIMHFFNPPRYMKLLEMVAGPRTSTEVADFIANWGGKVLGKGVVRANDMPNFIGNRIGTAFIARAFRLLETENIPVPDADSMFGTVFGFSKAGIFGLCDLVGIDIIGYLGKNSYDMLVNDEFREIYRFPEFVSGMLAKKMLGNKTRDTGGFYHTETDPKTRKKIRKALDIKTMEHTSFDKGEPDFVARARKLDALAERQKAVIDSSQFAARLTAFLFVYVAARVPEISETIVGIDNAMKWGYSWEAGPFEIWDNYGIKRSFKLIRDAGFEVPDKIMKMTESGNELFYITKNGRKQYYDFKSGEYRDVTVNSNCIFLADIKSVRKNIVKTSDSASLIDLGDGVFNLEYHSKMNAINKSMLDFILEAASYVDENGQGMVIGNQSAGTPGIFSAGGDLFYMIGLAAQKKYSEIDDFLREAHKAIMTIKYSSFPVVAAPYGMTLGGGCETCLAADRIVAHAELYMGLVEIGAGLLPSGAGMIHLWQRYMETVPAGVKIADYGAYFAAAFTAIAMAKVSSSAAEARNMCFLRPADRIVFNRDYLIGEAKKEVLRMADDGYRTPVKKDVPVMGREAQGMVMAQLYDMAKGGFVSPHMEFIAKKIAYCMSGGEAYQGQMVSEDYLLKLEREAFIELWKTGETMKMAEHMLKTGKPLMI